MKHSDNIGGANYCMQKIPALNGLVLSGGKSLRMGTDKGNIQYFDKSQRRHVFDMLSCFCEATFISCNAVQSERIEILPVIQDSFLDAGPLGGILSAFQYNLSTAWLTVACDLPFLDKQTISYLVNHRDPSKMATAFWGADSKFPEPLVSIWEPRAYPILLDFFEKGYRSPNKILLDSDVELLNATDTSVFKNVNTKEEYKEALSLFNKQP